QRSQARRRGAGGPHHRQDERAARAADHRGALPRVPGGGEDRPHRARPVRAQARAAGTFGQHPRALDRRPLPRALARVPLPRRRRRRRVPRERRLDGPQLLPPHRAVLPGARPGAQAARDPRRPAALPRRQLSRLGDAPRRRLRARQAAARPAPLGAGRAPLHPRHPELVEASRYKSKPLLARPFIALRVAAQGLAAAWRHEIPFRMEVVAFAVFFPLSFWVGKTSVERALLIGSLVLVLIVELLNSALEATLDRVSLEDHPLIGR